MRAGLRAEAYPQRPAGGYSGLRKIANDRSDPRIRGRAIMRHFMPLGLVLASLVVSGCSGGYYINPAQYPQGSPMVADDPPRRARVVPPAAEVRARPDRTGGAESTGTIGDGGQTRPPSAGGKAESEQALSRETAR